jgi:argininosuccinate lyase
MMPQKRNPDMLELIRGKTGGVYGQLVALLTMMKGQPLAYNRDMQEDKRFIFFAYDQVEACLTMAAAIVLHTTVCGDHIAQRLDEGFADATVMAEYLVKKGVPFRTAHHVVGSLVGLCDQQKLSRLSELDLPTMQAKCDAIQTDVYAIFGAMNVIEAYQSEGAGGVKQLATQLKWWKKHFT